MSLKKLKFRRQFLLSPKLCPDLEGWDFQEVGKHYLYVHPDCLQAFATSNGKRGILLGHVLNPRQPDLSTSEILEDIVQQSDEIGIAKSIYGLVGRFVLIVEKNNEFTFFNDACGLKSFFFTQQDHKFYAASQPLLLKLVTKNLIEQGERYHSYHDSEYVKSNKENWFPSGTSLYPGVYHLVANHYLKSETLQQTRYWPIKKLETINYEEAKEKFAKLLKLTIDAGSKKYKLGLGITGGFDSRILLSASKDAAERMLFYTLQYRNLDYNSNDIRIPVSLTQKINIPHSLMDCRIPISEEFKEIYLASSDMAHLNDWGHIAYGISQNLPEGTMSVKGSCSETGRCFFTKMVCIQNSSLVKTS
ncbi:hypothetical protein M601_015905 [Cellulophaga baltica 4]|nr:hypothetical protein M601_015905 [Cellulophaga baltica 4]